MRIILMNLEHSQYVHTVIYKTIFMVPTLYFQSIAHVLNASFIILIECEVTGAILPIFTRIFLETSVITYIFSIPCVSGITNSNIIITPSKNG